MRMTADQVVSDYLRQCHRSRKAAVLKEEQDAGLRWIFHAA
jgi:hypothetical protein